MSDFLAGSLTFLGALAGAAAIIISVCAAVLLATLTAEHLAARHKGARQH